MSWATSLPRTKLSLMSWLKMTQAFFTAGSVGDKHLQHMSKMTLANLSIHVPLPPHTQTEKDRLLHFAVLSSEPNQNGKGVLKCHTTLFAIVRLAVICSLLLGKGQQFSEKKMSSNQA